MKNQVETKFKDKPLKTFAKLGYSHLETAEIVSFLNVLLAAYHVHYQKLRNFHWNVVGPDFFDAHEKFELQYNEVKLNIDEVAERIRVFGMRPLSNLKEYLEISQIKEVSKPVTSAEMVHHILNDFEILLNLMNDVTAAATKINDRGTEDMMTTYIRQMEKSHWMFTAFLKSEKSAL